MANRYWRGGTGTWDASNTANWSATSGGAGGASAPTLNDDVFFDANSDAGGIFTVTIGTGAVCRDITIAGLDQVMTLSQGATSRLDIYGSLTLPATNFTHNASAGSVIALRATTTGKTITTNGVAIGTAAGSVFILEGSGGEWILGSALTISGSMSHFTGTFRTNNYNLTIGVNYSYLHVSTSRAIYLGTSIVSISGTAIGNGSTTTNLIFDAGTSQINCSAASPTFAGGGLTFNNVSFTSTAAGTSTITGANTFNNLTVTSIAATGLRNISVGANQAVNGTLTLGTANTAIRRMFMFSNVIGTPRMITATAIAALADVDFRDVVAAGASGTWSGARLGNCLGNSNITFDASKSVYRIGAGNWSATQWALSSGGAVNVNNFPLAQDDAVFDTNTTTGTHTLDANWQIGGINFSALTVAVTFATGTTTPSIYRDFVLDADVTITGTGATTFAAQGTTQIITSAGKTFTQQLTVNNATGSLQLQDALASSVTFVLTSGTLDLNNNDLTSLTFSSNNSNTRAIAFGTGSINLTGNNATVWNCATLTGFSYTGTPEINFAYSGSTGIRTINIGNAAGATEANSISVNITNGTDIIDIRSSGILNVNFTGFLGTLRANTAFAAAYGDVLFSAGMTIEALTSACVFAKSSGIQTITTNGKALDFPITKQGAGTLQLADNLTQGATRTFTHTAGTIDLNDNDLNAGLWSTTGALARHIDTGATGELHIAGATFTASGSNLTTSGTGLISMDSASSKTFAGGGFIYPTINQGGLGQLTITGANRFKDVTNTVQPCTIVFPANVTTSFNEFSLSGIAGNLVSLRSSTTGQQFILSKVV